MIKRIPLALLATLFSLSAFAQRASGQEKVPQNSVFLGLEETPDLLRKTDEAVKAKAVALVDVVDAEAKAKRIPPETSNGLRTALAAANSATSVDAQTFLGNLSLPADNEPVAGAVGALREVSAIATSQREALLRQFMAAIAKRMTALAREAKTSEEVESVLGIVQSIQAWGPEGSRSGISPRQYNSLRGCEQFLRALSRVLALKASDDASVVNSALRSLLGTAQGAHDFVSEDEIRNRILATTSPLKAAAEAAEDAVAEALIGRKPSVQVFAALAAYEDANKRFKAATAMLDAPGGRQNERDTSAYKMLAEVARSAETHHWDKVQQGLQSATQAVRQLESKRLVDFESLTSAWEKEARASVDAAIRELREQLRSKLAKVKTPGDLEAVAVDIDSTESSSRVGREASPVQGIAKELRGLAAAWASPDANAFAQWRSGEMNGRTSPFAGEIAVLRDQIEREKLAISLAAPELAAFPFRGMSQEAAIEGLVEKLATEGQWRRLLRLLEARNSGGRAPDGRPAGPNAIASVRSFLAAQNFERAEQWTDAALSYKTVLRNAEENTPVNESALRLRTLAKEHPKEVLAARSALHEEVLPEQP